MIIFRQPTEREISDGRLQALQSRDDEINRLTAEIRDLCMAGLDRSQLISQCHELTEMLKYKQVECVKLREALESQHHWQLEHRPIKYSKTAMYEKSQIALGRLC